MNAIRRLIGRGGKDDGLQLPQPVERAYVLSKDAGHRGPVLGGYIITGFENIEIACTVTPSGVTVVAADSGSVLTTFHPIPGDAFTASCLIPLSSPDGENRLCGLVAGTQSGLLVLVGIASKVREIARCEASKSAITAVAVSGDNLVVAGNTTGQLFLYDPVNHPETCSSSFSIIPERDAAVTAICPVASDRVWAAVDGHGISELFLSDSGSGLLSIAHQDPPVRMMFPNMQSVTSMVVSHRQNLGVCLSSCSDVFLINISDHSLVQQYPASLMTCGSALSVVAAAEPQDTGDSTFLILAGVDGSLAVRELNRREKDGKLQCVLHRCIDRLTPLSKEELTQQLDPAEGCPITSLSVMESLDHCVVGDAACSLYLLPLNCRKISRASTPSVQDEHRKSVDEITDELGEADA
jgi:hypothetical protein